jgi:uncharacterized protein YciI
MPKAILCLLLALVFFSLARAQDKKTYDSVLAKKLGADDFGMKPYVIAFLKRGNPSNLDTSQKRLAMEGHMKNIGRMAKEGQLVIAGPFLDKGNLAGIYIFNVKTVEEARALTATDPAVKAGIFEMELHPWYGSAELIQVTPIHYTLQKNILTD